MSSARFRSEQKYNSLSSSGSPVDHTAAPADQGSESAKIRRENILAELLDTEARYVSDLREVLIHYRSDFMMKYSDYP